VTFLLPGGLGQLGAHSLSAWDTTTTGWSNPPGLREAPEAIPLGSPGTPGGQSIAPLLAPTVITENFPTVENPLSSGGQWMHQTTYWANMAVFNFPPHICYGLQDGTNIYGDAYAYLSPLFWPPSHTDVTVAYTVNKAPNAGNIDEWEAVFRVVDNPLPGGVGTVKLYEVNYNSDGAYSQFVAWDGTPGTFTIIDGGPGVIAGLVTGDIISVTFQGLTHTLKRNGTTIWSATDPGTGGGDPNYTGPFHFGQPGFGKFFQGTAGTGNKMGFTQVVVTSAPYTAPTPSNAAMNVSSLSTAGTIVGQIPCQHNPTSWSIVGVPSPPGSVGYFAIDSFANVVVQAAAVGNIVASTYSFTVQATNSFGSNTALVTLTNVGVTGPIFSNGNRTIIDGDNSHGRPLAVRAKNSVLTTGTAASRRRYVEIKLGNAGEPLTLMGFVSVGVVVPTWAAPTVSALPLGFDTSGLSVGFVATSAAIYVAIFEGSGAGRVGAVTAGDIVGISIDNSGVNFPGATALWFSVNGVYASGGTTFPGLATPDIATPTLTQVWPACSTDYQNHVTINPNPAPLYMPAGFLALG
jgi:hypothetical protein